MQDIIIILGCISLGMAFGYGQRNNRLLLACADKASLYAVYGLLFILGVRLGADRALLAKLALLGSRALCIAVLCTSGSVLAVALVGRWFPAFERSKDAKGHASAGPSPLWGSARIMAAFVLGIALGLFSLAPVWMQADGLATYALYFLVLVVGVGLGADIRAFRILRDLRFRILAVPALVVAGSAAGSVVASLVLPGMSVQEALCVGAGLGYYSLSSILIESAGDSALASTALLANILREVIAILSAPLLARHCGRLSTVAASGATAMDTTLPVIARFSGEHAAVVAVFSGMTLTLLVPFLVTAALQLR